MSSLDNTGGVFYSSTGAANTSPTTITGNDAGTGESQESNQVQLYSNTLYVSTDSKEGSSNRDYIGTLGTIGGPPPTTLANSGDGPSMLTGYGDTGGTGRVKLTASQSNGFTPSGDYTNLSPQNYFFASSTVLYVADDGSPKNNSADKETDYSLCGAGGLQKWVNVSGTWTWEYTLYLGLNLVENPSCSSNTTGTTGLYGLTGYVSGGVAYLFATNYTIADLDQTYLYGITDTVATTTDPGTSFTLLATAPADTNFKGVSLAPTIPAGYVEITSSPSGLAFMSSGTGCAPGSYTTPQTLSWTPGSSCTLSVAPIQSGPTGVQYAFAQWQDGSTGTSDTVTAPTTTATYSAAFTTEYQLTTAAGTGDTVSAGGYFASGSNAVITATPNAGYYFVNFTGTTTSTNNPLTLAMTAPQSITANFALIASQTITFGALTNQINGVAPLTVSATASSGLPVSFASLTPSVCTVSAATVT
jgi:hypothetical protein